MRLLNTRGYQQFVTYSGKIPVILISFLLLLGSPQLLLSVPAYPYPIEYTQPDGTVIILFLKGDEKVNWAETPDGYTILVTKDGFYEYAVHDEYGDLVFSGIPVSEYGDRNEKEAALLKQLSKGLFFSKRQVEMMRGLWDTRTDDESRAFPTTGERRLLSILMQTPDKPFTKTREDFDALFNQLNYSLDGASGSVRDYYLENSYHQFDLRVDVAGPYTAANNMAHYGSSWGGARQLATEAVHLAHPDVDFSDYDNSGDGNVEGFYMIFSGYGEEAGGGPNTIWSHAWSIEPVQMDGVWLRRYACSPELRGNSGTNITRIGVIGHEFGHILGAPDFYDTDGSGSGGQFVGTGRWDMMASGTWNNGGATPAHHNAYTKTYLYNWAEAEVLNTPQSITMEVASEYRDSFYRINTNTPGEHYLLENRHQIGFDAYIPGEGLIIYRVHKEVATSGNSVNVGHPQKMYPVCAGANTNPGGAPWTYGNINSDITPFPGSTNQDYFSDYSTPHMRSWAGENTNKPLTGITHDPENMTVSFDFADAVDILTDWLHLDDGLHSGSVGLGAGGVYQIAARFEPEDLAAFHDMDLVSVRLYVNDAPTSAAIKVWQGASYLNLQEIAHKEFSPPVEDWIEVVLDEPVTIDPSLELWFGVEYDDPGANVFSASRDAATNHDGKGNLLRMDTDDPESWVLLSDYNITGDWNLQARLASGDFNMVHYNVNGTNGSLTASLNDNEINSGALVPAGSDISFTATGDDGFSIKAWTLNGILIDDFTETQLDIINLSEHIVVTVEYQAIYHMVSFEADGGGGVLKAEVDGTEIFSGTEVQANTTVQFTAVPDTDYIVSVWTLNGTVIEEHTGEELEVHLDDGDIMVTVSFQSTVSLSDHTQLPLKVFPNPASEVLYVESPTDINSIVISDISGNRLRQLETTGSRASVPLSQLPAGVYVITIYAQENIVHRKIQIINP